MDTHNLELLSRLNKDPWFGSLDANLASELIALSVHRTLNNGQHLFFRGDPPDGLFVVLSGVLRVSGVTETGAEAVLSLLEPSMWFGEVSLFDGLPRAHNVSADGPATLLQIRQADMEALLRASPRHWHALGILMALKARLLFFNLEGLAMLPSNLRLARRLVWMACSSGVRREHHVCRLAVTQSDLAATAYMSRQTVNQILKSLQEQGIVRISAGAIDILNGALLADVAQLSAVEKKMLLQMYPLPPDLGKPTRSMAGFHGHR